MNEQQSRDRENGLLDFLKTTAPYEWILTWPDWAKYVAGALVVATLPAILESYRSWVRKLVSAVWHRLKQFSPKSVVTNVREKRRVRRVRKRGRLEAAERMSRALEILPHLNGPEAEKILRKYSLRPSDEFIERKRFGNSTSLILDWSDQERYRHIVNAERESNPIVKEGCALWLVDDSSVIVAKEDGTLGIGTGDQEKAAQEGFVRRMEGRLGSPTG